MAPKKQYVHFFLLKSTIGLVKNSEAHGFLLFSGTCCFIGQKTHMLFGKLRGWKSLRKVCCSPYKCPRLGGMDGCGIVRGYSTDQPSNGFSSPHPTLTCCWSSILYLLLIVGCCTYYFLHTFQLICVWVLSWHVSKDFPKQKKKPSIKDANRNYWLFHFGLHRIQFVNTINTLLCFWLLIMYSTKEPHSCMMVYPLVGAHVEQYMTGMYLIEDFMGCIVGMIVCFHYRFAYAWGVLSIVDH